MYQLTFNLPEQQWLRIVAAARGTWPNDKLSGAEIIRWCVILGVRTLPYLSPASAKQFVAIYRSYAPPYDGNPPSTIPSESEGDPSDKTNFRS